MPSAALAPALYGVASFSRPLASSPIHQPIMMSSTNTCAAS